MSAPVQEYKGLRYGTHTEVYVPHDDTWLLVEAVRTLGRLGGRRVVEVGCGAGLGVIQAAVQGAAGVGIDRNRAAVRLTLENAARNDVRPRIIGVVGDLSSCVDLAAVDLVLFNPPYLPTAPEERLPGDLNLAFDGGPSGNETLRRFVADLADAATATATAPGVKQMPDLVWVTSSLNDRAGLKRTLRAAGWADVTELGTAAFPFERLYAERLTWQGA